MFPSLVNCCTIDWFTTWPEEALLSVAQNTLEQIVQQDQVEKMASACYIMHSVRSTLLPISLNMPRNLAKVKLLLQSVEAMTIRFWTEMKRHYYVTPSSYLDLLKMFTGILKTKSDQVTYQKKRISNGLKVGHV